MDYYPDAKVLLSVRGAEEWARSMRKTDLGRCSTATRCCTTPPRRARSIDPLWKRYIDADDAA